jgi:hypothetical protein
MVIDPWHHWEEAAIVRQRGGIPFAILISPNRRPGQTQEKP